MVFRGVDAAAHRGAQHHRAAQPATGAVAQAGGVVDQVIKGGIHKAGKLDFAHRAQALRGHADGHAGDLGFRQRRIQHALFAKALLQAEGGAEHAAVFADVFAKQHHIVVVRQFPGQGGVDGVEQGEGVHACPLSVSSCWRCAARSAGSSAYR